MKLELTFDLLPVVSVALVFLAYYLPGFNKWFEELAQEWKQGVMVLFILAAGIAVAGLSYLGVVDVYPVTDLKATIVAVIVDVFLALAANAGIYTATKYINERVSGYSLGKRG